MGINLIKRKQRIILAYEIPSQYLKKGKEIGKELKDFEILQYIAKGSYGFVAKVKSKINGEIYALKKDNIEFMNIYLRNKLKNEILFLNYFNNFSHSNVCRCLTIFEDNGFYFVMNFFNNKDLYRYLNAFIKLGIKISEEVLWDIFNQCLNGLLYIHNQGVIHRDIKIGNIFMDDKRRIQIGDFGESAVFDKNKIHKFTDDQKERENLLFNPNQVAGTEFYMAPEIYQGKYDQKADVFSMGVCFYVLCFASFPYTYNLSEFS